ncbi:MAG: DUF2460 domain-containing protein [Candidatus Solibacter sp.]
MASFPKLKTGAVAQYPLARQSKFQNQIVRFLDGTDQRYRDSAGERLSWKIDLSELDAGELAALEKFFQEAQGAFGSFEFVDPWDDRVHEHCSLDGDLLRLATLAESRGETTLTIVKDL